MLKVDIGMVRSFTGDRYISNWLRSFLIFTVMLVNGICVMLTFLKVTYNSSTFTNYPWTAGEFPV